MISNADIISAVGTYIQGSLSHVANVFTIRIADLVAQSQSQIRADIVEYVEGVLTPLVSEIVDEVTFDKINIYNLTTDSIEPQMVWNTLTQGGNAAAELPVACAGLIIGRTGVSRRLGRKFFPTFVEGRATGSFWDTTMTTKLLQATLAYINNWTGGNGVMSQPGIVEKLLGGGIGVFRTFIGGSVQAQVAYQRRRKYGVGT